jgi:hypothetical protein
MDGLRIQPSVRDVDVPRRNQHSVKGKTAWPFPVRDGVRTEDSVRLMQGKHVKMKPNLDDMEEAPL